MRTDAKVSATEGGRARAARLELEIAQSFGPSARALAGAVLPEEPGAARELTRGILQLCEMAAIQAMTGGGPRRAVALEAIDDPTAARLDVSTVLRLVRRVCYELSAHDERWELPSPLVDAVRLLGKAIGWKPGEGRR